MWRSEGYNLSREVLLAIRQSNENRVEHLVAGLLTALQRSRRQNAESAPDDSRMSLGTSMWDFACMTQKLARRSLGTHREPFWDEVSQLVGCSSSKLHSRELAVFCNAFAMGAPDRLLGSLGEKLGSRAAELAGELNAKDLTMVVHGLSKSVPARGDGPIDELHIVELANAAKRLKLDADRPLQASLLMNAFAKLSQSSDADLFGNLFRAAHSSLHKWDVQAVSLLCNAFASMGRRARAKVPDEHWRDVANRCVEVLPDADAQHLACMAHGLANVGAEPAALTDFYDGLEKLLCDQPRINDCFSAQDVALVAHSLARHRRPEKPLGKTDLTPGTCWPFEEFASRRMRQFELQGLALMLHSSVRLGRGGKSFFLAICQELRRQGVAKMTAPGVAITCSAASEALPVLGRTALGPLRHLQAVCHRRTDMYTPWQMLWILQAYAKASEWSAESESRPLWSNPTDARELLFAMCLRARDIFTDPARISVVLKYVGRIVSSERLPVDLKQDLDDLLLGESSGASPQSLPPALDEKKP